MVRDELFKLKQEVDRLGENVVTDERQRLIGAFGRLLVEVMARHRDLDVQFEAEKMFLARQAWPDLGEGADKLLLRYLRVRGADLDADSRFQAKAYGAGLPQPVALVLRDIGLRGSDPELIDALAASSRLWGTRSWRGSARAHRPFADPDADIRRRVFGDRLAGAVDRESLVDELIAGAPRSEPGRAVLLDGSESLESRVRVALEQAYVGVEKARERLARDSRFERDRLVDLKKQTGKGPSWYHDLPLVPSTTVEQFTGEQRVLVQAFRVAERSKLDAFRLEREACAMVRQLDIVQRGHQQAQAAAHGDCRIADSTVLNLLGEHGNDVEIYAPPLWAHSHTPGRGRGCRQCGLGLRAA